jgi:tetratricopeptide (TPR) repeat protein
MQGSIVSDLTGGVMVRAGGASATDPATLPPDWLTLLMDGDAQALLAALPAHVRVPEHASGSRAEEHAVRADLQRALAQGDSGTERNCCARLAALLWARGVSRREAIALTHRAVALRDDDETRLLLVARLEHLGLLSDAAAALAPCVSRSATAREAAELLIRMATDQVRAGDPQSAMKNLLEAATARHGSGQVQDLAGTLAGALGLPETSTIFLEAAERYDAAGNAEGAFTARRRAFEFAPADARACDALVASLRGMQRHEAADAVLRRHARASAPERSHATHIARLQASLAADDGARALVAVIDGRLESAVAGAEERWVDEAFSRAGLHELVALRCELRAQATQGAARAREYLALASLYVDRLAAPDRALEAWIAALQADPLCGEARASLRTVTRAMQDQSALMEGLLRAATATRDTTVAIDCLRELAKLAEDRLAEPSLASWAYARMAQLGASGLDLEQARARLVPRLRLQQSALATAREAAQKTDQPTRIEAIRRIATILRGRPDELDAYLEALQELLSQGVAERRWWVEFERAATRAERYDLLASVARKRLAAGIPRADAAHLQSLLVMLAVRKGDMASVAQEAHALADAVPGIRLAICAGWLAHAALGDEQARATAIERAASLLAMPMKATLLACAGEIYVQLGQLQQAHRLAEQARQVDAAEPQVLSFSGAMAAFTRDPALHRLAEKAWSIYLPDGEQHQGLVLAFTEAGDPLPAYMWVRRWLDLRPWDTAVLQRLVDAAVATHSAETLSGACCKRCSPRKT